MTGIKRTRKRYDAPEELPPVPSPQEQLDGRELQIFYDALDHHAEAPYGCVAIREIEDEMALLHAQMTARERKVNSLLIKGYSPPEVAAELHCSLPTVYNNRWPEFLALHDRHAVLTLGSTKAERVGWLRAIALRSLDENNPRWFAPKTALAAIQQMSQLAGDLNQVQSQAPPAVTITIDLTGNHEKEVCDV